MLPVGKSIAYCMILIKLEEAVMTCKISNDMQNLPDYLKCHPSIKGNICYIQSTFIVAVIGLYYAFLGCMMIDGFD